MAYSKIMNHNFGLSRITLGLRATNSRSAAA
jgi:hypothetical protein